MIRFRNAMEVVMQKFKHGLICFDKAVSLLLELSFSQIC